MCDRKMRRKPSLSNESIVVVGYGTIPYRGIVLYVESMVDTGVSKSALTGGVAGVA